MQSIANNSDENTNNLNSNNIKLHLGCGNNYISGYINIDTDKNVIADIYGDYSKLDKFASGSVKEILMIHSINYLNLWQAKDFFLLSYELLCDDGILIIETPNLMKAIDKIYHGNLSDIDDYLEGVRALHAFGMDQIYNREKYIPYAFSWSPWHLKKTLEEVGFYDIKIVAPHTHVAWRDMRIEAKKFAKLDINVEQVDKPSIVTDDKQNHLGNNNTNNEPVVITRIRTFLSRLKLAIRFIFNGN